MCLKYVRALIRGRADGICSVRRKTVVFSIFFHSLTLIAKVLRKNCLCRCNGFAGIWIYLHMTLRHSYGLLTIEKNMSGHPCFIYKSQLFDRQRKQIKLKHNQYSSYAVAMFYLSGHYLLFDQKPHSHTHRHFPLSSITKRKHTITETFRFYYRNMLIRMKRHKEEETEKGTSQPDNHNSNDS